MSGFLGAIATGAGLASTILGAGGDTVHLGPFEFRGMELPADMPFGGEQRMSVHKMPGGKRVIDVMGDDPTDINWSGMFFSVDALARAQQVDAIRIAGKPVMLRWRNFMYAVLVKSFVVQDRQPGYCTYSISCTVLQDMSKPATVSVIAPIVQAYSDINTALGLVSALATSPAPVATAIGAAQSAVKVIS